MLTFGNCDRYISQLIENQFPGMFREEAQQLIAFLTAYYEFEEQNLSQFLRVSGCLGTNGDVDTVPEEYLRYFKRKYMRDFPYINSIDNRFLIKNIMDVYRSKGTERSLMLLMQMICGEDAGASIYYPGQDVLRPSHSMWWQPRYLELSSSGITPSLVGKRIVGSVSGATAFIESATTKRINGQMIDVVYLSDIRGEFVTRDIITDTKTGALAGAPRVTGSLTEIEITTSGVGFSIGDLLDVSTTFGSFGIAKVSSLSGVDNKVTFDIVDGGFGYTRTVDANGIPLANPDTKIIVSDSILGVENSGLVFGDNLCQRLENISLIPSPAGVNVGDPVVSPEGTGRVISVGATSVDVEITSNSMISSTTATIAGAAYTVSGTTNNHVCATVMESNDTQVWLYDTNNVGAWYTDSDINVLFDSNGNTHTLNRVYQGSGASFEIADIENVETVTYATDFIGDTNILGNLYLTTLLSDGDFGFPAAIAPNEVISTRIVDALQTKTVDVGSISQISMVYPGTGYDTDVKVLVINPYVAGQDIFNVELYVGELNGFGVGDIVEQLGSNAKGEVVSFQNGWLTLKPLSYSNRFIKNQVVLNTATGRSYIPTKIKRNLDSLPMGANAIITAKTQPFDGAVGTVKVLSSGYGYVDGEIATLTPQDGKDPITGVVRTGNAGRTAGRWLTTTSHLNWSTYIHDNDYYQEYSYEISSSCSIDKYGDVLYDVNHVSGTKLFGKVVKSGKCTHQHTCDGTVEIL